MYNPKSVHAEEFIDHEEVLDSLQEAARESKNHERVLAILEKAALCKGLTHREAAILMDCDEPGLEEKIYDLASTIKHRFYGNRIVLFAPLYLSNYCINGCIYCPYHAKNRTIPRRKLTQKEIEDEVRALIRSGHKRLAIEAGEDPRNNPLEYILDSVKTTASTKAATASAVSMSTSRRRMSNPTASCTKPASAHTSCSRKLTTRRITSACTPPAPRATTPGTPKPWTGPRKAAVTTWASASCSASATTATSSSAC